MPSFQPLSAERHSGYGWSRFDNHQFASHVTLASLSYDELSKVCMFLPIAFVQMGEQKIAQVLLGLRAEENLLVSEQGAWQGGYIPAGLRTHPFALLPLNEGQLALCVDEDSAWVSQFNGEMPFFQPSGEPTAEVADIFKFLVDVEKGKNIVLSQSALLDELGLLEPWTISVQSDAGTSTIADLYKVNEVALAGLAPETLARLRDSGAFPLMYAQLFSMQHIRRLEKLAADRAAGAAQAETATIDFSGFAPDTLRF